jgi:hypothetical protein
VADRFTAPPYGEEQATAWLAWQAYNMRRRDLTIFQIENLQPDWLAGRKETAPHLIIIHSLWGLWGGLILGLIGGLFLWINFGLGVELIHGLIPGLLTGLLVGLLSGLRSGLSVGLISGLSARLISGLIFALFGGLRVTLLSIDRQLHTVESLHWSWQHARKTAKMGLIVGLIIGPIVWLTYGLVGGIIGGMIGVILGGMIVGIIGGIQSRDVELKTRPNQGIWLTLSSVLKI